MGSNPSRFQDDNLPVEKVSWNDCQKFIKNLNAKGEGMYRLPSEAEWEYCCRAGTTTAYACGDSESCLDAMAWYNANSGKKTYPVGQKQPNAWGLYDMHGNVREWCHDWYGDSPIYRGGSWNDYANYCRSAFRCSFVSANRNNGYIGLRLLRSLP
jgi:formylglycine-generating enzyme required for sulfatase activity